LAPDQETEPGLDLVQAMAALDRDRLAQVSATDLDSDQAPELVQAVVSVAAPGMVMAME